MDDEPIFVPRPSSVPRAHPPTTKRTTQRAHQRRPGRRRTARPRRPERGRHPPRTRCTTPVRQPLRQKKGTLVTSFWPTAHFKNSLSRRARTGDLSFAMLTMLTMRTKSFCRLASLRSQYLSDHMLLRARTAVPHGCLLLGPKVGSTRRTRTGGFVTARAHHTFPAVARALSLLSSVRSVSDKTTRNTRTV
jgi:hypothetical protein